MSRAIILAVTSLVLLSGQPAQSDPLKPDTHPLVRAMRDELKRSMKLSLPGMARPYFISYMVEEVQQLNIAGEFGGVLMSDRRSGRRLRVELRLGDYKKDNSNFIGSMVGSSQNLVVDNNYDALRRQIWLATDRAYKAATTGMERKKAAMADQKKSGDELPDFTRSPRIQVVVPGIPHKMPAASVYEQLVRKAAAEFWDYPMVQEGYVVVSVSVIHRYYVSSEGSFFYEPRAVAHFMAAAGTQAADGMPLANYVTRTAARFDDLKSFNTLIRDVTGMLNDLEELRTAPRAEQYSGPILFEGAAAGQVLGRLLLRNLSGTPAPSSKRGRLGPANQFEDKLKRKVLPASFTVVDDPTARTFKGLPLLGGYRVDDEGVVARKVALVKKGKLLGRLMSRTPSKAFPGSNGHGRAPSYGAARGGPSNVLVTSRGTSRKQLIRKLLAEARKADEKYAIVIKQLPYPMATGRLSGLGGSSAAFTGGLLAYKVTRDGKETPIRGVSLGRLQVKQLKHILAAGDKLSATNHVGQYRSYAGSAFAFTPVTLVTPSLLFKEVELTKTKGAKGKLPLLKRPGKKMAAGK